MDDTNFFSTETIDVLIDFRLFAIVQLSFVNKRENIQLSGTGA